MWRDTIMIELKNNLNQFSEILKAGISCKFLVVVEEFLVLTLGHA